jgi:hypothetical protein
VGTSRAGERIEPVYREGAKVAVVQSDSMHMEMDEAVLMLNGMELPPEVLEESGMEMPSMDAETTIQGVDEVLAATDRRPTRVRRTFQRLRESSVENGETKERTGPLEGRTIVLEQEEGEVSVELEDEGDEVDDVFLEGHRLTNYVDLLLPETEVEVGDSWQVEGEELREFIGMASGPTFFEDEEEEDNPLAEMLEDESTVTGDVTLLEIEEREGVRSAVLAYTIELTAQADDPEVFGAAPEGMEYASGALEIRIEVKGKLWYALGEGRPVAAESSFDGTFECHFEVRGEMEGNEMVMKVELTGSIDGEGSCRWSPLE